MSDVDRVIREVLQVRRGDSLPFSARNRNVTRMELPKLFARLGYTHGAEVGVWEGVYSEALLLLVPGLRLVSVDNWEPYEGSSQERMNIRRARAEERLGKYAGCTIWPVSSRDAAIQINDGTFDFVYIDADHSFDGVMSDLIQWAPKVKRGGIVAGHDYFESYQYGVVAAVRAYTQAHRIVTWYVTGEREASWLWVRQ